MKNITDIYIKRCKKGRKKEKNEKLIGRIIIDSDDTFEGYVCSYDQEEVYFIYGKIDEDKISFAKSDERSVMYRAFRRTSKLNSSIMELTDGDYNMILLPQELTREPTEAELIRLEVGCEMLKNSLSPLTKKEYTDFKNQASQEKVLKKGKTI